MDHEKESAVLRIGELSRRVGVSEHVLRAWESRYGLLRPERSAGGYRLYSEDDQSRVRRMQAHLADGLAAAQAARAAIAEQEPTPATGIATDAGEVVDAADLLPGPGLIYSAGALAQALDELDEPGAQAVFDRLLTDFTLETVFRDVVLPYLRELGQRWEQGSVSVAQEHFASHVIRGRLEGLARGWGSGRGPQALLFCPPDELHDLALLVFGIVLNRRGWRIAYLGVNTPMDDAIQVTSDLRPALVVMAATRTERFAAIVPELSRLAGRAPLVLAGPGATQDLAKSVGARLVAGDPVAAAEHLTSSLR
jgi:MerR family transcriptional regulator, light-induced transcriptional regulator